MNPPRGELDILGAGLCGSLLAILMAKRGFRVRVREARPDPRTVAVPAGRSINLALAARGIRGLSRAGIFDAVRPLLLPMRGRMIHDRDGNTRLLPYGQRDHELIYSVSRAELNRLLIDVAERDAGVEFLFRHEVTGYDGDSGQLEVEGPEGRYSIEAEALLAADGAGSRLRRAHAGDDRIAPEESLLPHSYKELTIPPRAGGGFELDPEALHIWPRSDFMLIALPNPGGDFTLTLFMPNGEDGFAGLDDGSAVTRLFEVEFPDVVALIPDLVERFLGNPTGILGTVRCQHWHDRDRFLLIGDAAHAIVPFHGQGMNLAFEDCVVFDRLIADRDQPDWEAVFGEFETARLDDANAIADMALENYVEMRDTVRDPAFALRKELAFELERRFPDRFIPRYSMVMFHDDIPYAVAAERGRVQAELLSGLTRNANSLGQVDLDTAARRVRERLPPLASIRRV